MHGQGVHDGRDVQGGRDDHDDLPSPYVFLNSIIGLR